MFQDDRHFDVGHQLVAIAPEAFQSREDFDQRLEELVAQARNVAERVFAGQREGFARAVASAAAGGG